MASTAELAIIISAKDSASKQIDGLAKSLGGLGGIGKVATAALAGVATAGLALAGGIGVAINSAATFESAMSAVGAVSGASNEELQALSDTALRLGQDTTLAGIGASDAAAAMQALAAGGVSTQDILEGAAKGALLLASAGGIEVPRAAEIAANAMTAFGLAGTDVAHIADLLAAAANASSADVGDLGESLKFVAPIAHSMGLSIEEVVATLTEFGTQGIKGSMAGTALRSILSSLAKPSKQAQQAIEDLGLEFFDSSGKMKTIAGISDQLKTKLGGLTDQQRANTLVTLFGNEALSAATILYGEGAEGIKKYLGQVDIAGSAAANGAKRNDNLKGSIEQLKSSWQTATIVLGQAFLPAVRGVVDAITGAVNAAIPFVKQYGPVLVAALTQGIGAVVGFGKSVGTAIGAVVDAFLKLRDGQITLAQFIGGLEIFVSTIRDRLAGLAAIVAPYLGAFFSAIGSFIATYGPQIAAQFLLWAGSFVNWITDTAIPWLLPKLAAFGTALVGWVTGTAVPAVVAAAGQLATALGGWLGAAATYVVGQLPTWRDALVGWVRDTAAPAVASAASGLVGALGNWIRGEAIPFLAANFPYWIAALESWIRDSAVPTVVGAVVGIKNALGDWVAGAASYLTEKLPIWLAALGDWITGTVIPTVVGLAVGIGNALVGWVEGTAIPVVKDKLAAWTGTVTDYISGTATEAIRASGDENLPGALNHWMVTADTESGGHMATWANTITAFLDGLPGRLTAALVPAAAALGNWIGEAIPGTVLKLAMWGRDIFAFIQTLPLTLPVMLAKASVALYSWIGDAIGPTALKIAAWGISLTIAIFQFGMGVINTLYGLVGAMIAAGAALAGGIIDGIINGLTGGRTRVASAAASLAGAAVGGAAGHLEEKSPSKVFERIGKFAVDGLVNGLDAGQQEAAKKAAEVASTIAKAITDTLGALGALAKFKGGPSAGQLAGFTAATSALLTALTDAAKDFTTEGLKAAADFADAAGKVGSGITNALTGLKALASADFATASPTGNALGWFAHLVSSLVATMADAAEAFDADALKAATDFADAASKVGGGVANALKGLQELASADWAKSSPTGSALGWFTHLAASLVANFAQAATLFTDESLNAANAFADSAGKVGGAVGSALTGLQALAKADWAVSSPSGSAMGWFTHLVASLVENFRTAATAFTSEGLKAAGEFAEAAGKVASVIGPAVTGLAAINTLVSPPKQAVDNLLAGIRYIVGKFGEMATTLSTEGVKKLGDFSEAANKALGAAKSGVDLFKDFDKLVIPSKEAIDNLTIAVHYVVDRFGEMADNLNTEGIARLQAFATAAGTALATAKTGTDLFKAFDKLVIPSKEAIDNLLAAIVYVVTRMGEIADWIGKAGLQKAQDFATGAKNVFDTVKASLDLLKTLTEYKDLPRKALDDLFDGMVKALERMGELQGQASAMKQQADTFLGTMRDAARMIAEGLALGGQVPNAGGFDPIAAIPDIFAGVPKMASGGIVTAPTLALIGERGPEAVVPLSGRRGGGGITVQIMAPIYGVDHLEEVVVRAVTSATARGRLAAV